MKILAIETSCDDTAVAVLEARGNKKAPDFSVLANVVSSQTSVHKKYGGVYPAMAKREHQKNLTAVLTACLKEAGLLKKAAGQGKGPAGRDKELAKILEREPELYKKLLPFLAKYEKPDGKGGIDLIAITQGPGLEPCLWVGVNFARALSYFWGIPVVPVNHIEAHILVNTLENKGVKFSAVALVVSGGHTQIILMKGIGKYKILGETRDDAAGECFDKCAKLLGLGYPGGPEIARLAAGGRAFNQLPRPMFNTKDYDFSFSGLKTAVLYHHRKQPLKIQKSKKYIKTMCTEIQQAIIDVLLKKTIKAGKDYSAKTIILGGGVSANKELRKQMGQRVKKELPGAVCLWPAPPLSTDNAVMTAVAGFFNKTKIKNWKAVKADANMQLPSGD